MPTAVDVERFVGKTYDAAEALRAEDNLALVTEFVRAYTRGRGFNDTGSRTASCRPSSSPPRLVCSKTRRSAVENR